MDPTTSDDDQASGAGNKGKFEWKRFGNLNLDQNIEITADSVEYWIEQPNPKGKGTTRRQILHGVSLKAPPGQLIALMGPTGCGKTTFINILSSRLRENVSGTLLYNQIQATPGLRRLVAYVLQQDILFPNLTVRETLTFAALLRLPTSVSRQDKLERVEEMIRELGLEKCSNTIIGGGFVRGVSGGEKKRVCIGCELILNPPICLLDEPTTGLDASTAFSLLKTLKRLAESGRTVIASIHQPSSQMFNFFDRVMFLCDGYTIFNDNPRNVVPYLASQGFECPDEYNPSDYLMELLVENKDAKDQLIQGFLDYAAKKKTEEEVLPVDSSLRESTLLLGGHDKFPISWFEQVHILAQRHWIEYKQILKNKYQYYQILGFCLLIGLVWFQIGTQETDIFPRIAVLWWLSAFASFIPGMASITGMLSIRPILGKDRASGIYPLSAWVAAKTIVELSADLIIPAVFIQCYWLIGYYYDVGGFLTTWFFFAFLFLIQRTVGFFLISIRPAMKEAFVLLSTYILINMSASNFLINLDQSPVWVSWLKYISVNRYFLEAVTRVQFEWPDLKFSQVNGTENAWDSYPVSADEILSKYDVVDPIWACFLFMLGYWLLALVLAFYSLRRTIPRK